VDRSLGTHWLLKQFSVLNIYEFSDNRNFSSLAVYPETIFEAQIFTNPISQAKSMVFVEKQEIYLCTD